MLLDGSSSTFEEIAECVSVSYRCNKSNNICPELFCVRINCSINKHQVTGIQSFTSEVTAIHYDFHVYLESFRNKTTPITDVLIHVVVKPYVTHNIS